MQAGEEAAYLDYHVRWRAGGARPGKHAARQAGQSGDFRGYRPFWQLPDARQIDVRRSIMDPFGGVMVRQTEQRSAITLIVAVDVSRSMAPAPGRSHLPSVALLIDAAARSAIRAGDDIGVLVFDERVRTELCTPPTRQRGVARFMAEALVSFEPAGRDARGVIALAEHLPHRKCLVLLISDFLMPPSQIEAAMASLTHHDVAPVVLDNFDGLDRGRFGLLRTQDAETGRNRLVLLRPTVSRRAAALAAARRDMLNSIFRRHGRSGFFANGAMDINALSHHLAGL